MQHKRTQHDQAGKRSSQAQGSAADAAFTAGDYKTALRLYLQIGRSGAGTPMGQLALARAQALHIDPVAVGAGLGTLALLAIASVWALTH